MNNHIRINGFSIYVVCLDGLNIEAEPLGLVTVSVVFTVNVPCGKERSEMNSEAMCYRSFININREQVGILVNQFLQSTFKEV
jgi:hypothetical protein